MYFYDVISQESHCDVFAQIASRLKRVQERLRHWSVHSFDIAISCQYLRHLTKKKCLILIYFFSAQHHSIILGFTGTTLQRKNDFLERWRRTQLGVISMPLLPSCQASYIQRNRNNRYLSPASIPFDIFRYLFLYRYLLLMVSGKWHRYWTTLSFFHLLASHKVCVTLACQTTTTII